MRPSSLSLWRALIRRRDRGDLGEGEWFTASLVDLARWSRIAYATAKAALAELRRAGLVATSRCSRSRWVRCRSTGDLVTVNALEENLYLAAGSLRTRGGVDEIAFPARAWRAFTAQRSRVRVEAWRAALPRVEWRRGWSEEVERGFRSRSAGLPQVSSTSVPNVPPLPLQSETSEKAALRADPLRDRLLQIIQADEDDDDPVDLGQFTLLGSVAPRPPALGTPSTAPFLPPDSHDRPPLLVTYVSPEQLPELKARAVVDGYRWAVREVYGVEWWHYSKGDITKAKHYDRLLACGVALAEHSVPAEHWAIWRLRWFKASVRQFSSKPPPVWIVMAAKTVSEKAGWFRKDYNLPVATLQPDPIIAEQHLRNVEAARRWAGFTGDAVFYFVFPGWYVDKRKAEIAGGATEPHDCWPTKPGSKYGKVVQR